MIFETVEDLYHYKYNRVDSAIETMIANGSANWYALKGILQIEQCDTIDSIETKRLKILSEYNIK